MRARSTRMLARASVVTTVACSLLAAAVPTHAEHAARAGDGAALYLVTLEGPGTAGDPRPPADAATAMLRAQDDLLASVGAGDPVYRWTTALDGFAVELDGQQAAALADDPDVALVERDRVVPLAATSARGLDTAPAQVPDRRGPDGAGTVIGFVDSGIAPGSPAFRVGAGLGPTPRGFRGSCSEAPDDPGWDADSCNAKVVAAQYFVDGFGTDALRSAEVLSPLDTDGHGTEVASVAAGAADVRVRTSGHRLGRFSGVAPRARIAAYKACWTAPDPDDDGCATADVVAAIDRATADGVDVLNLSVGGRTEIDTVERALLGAAESGIVVTAAAGNTGDRAAAAHPAPWVLTVGASHAAERVGDVVTSGGLRLEGASSAVGPVGGRLVLGSDLRATGATRDAARHCLPGSLDAGRTGGAVVVCARGGGPRLDKSRAVDLAGGAGMVLVNTRRGSVDADLHAVPTVHLAAPDARRLLRWERRAARDTRPARVRLVPQGVERGPDRVAAFSPAGVPTSTVLKPDLVAPGTEVVAATPEGWDLVSGTSASAARVAGAAAVLLGRPGATPARVRSALSTTATPVAGPGLRIGAGLVDVGADPGLAFLVPSQGYRAWLDGRRSDLDLPQVLLADGRLRVRRTLTNTSDRTLVLTARTSGFRDGVRVSPEWARLEPGDRFGFTVSVPTAPTSTDDGTVEWRAGSTAAVRVPVVVTR